MVDARLVELMMLDSVDVFDNFHRRSSKRGGRRFHPRSLIYRKIGRSVFPKRKARIRSVSQRQRSHFKKPVFGRIRKPILNPRRRGLVRGKPRVRSGRAVYNKPYRIITLQRSKPPPIGTRSKPLGKPTIKRKKHPIKLTPNDTVMPYRYKKRKPSTVRKPPFGNRSQKPNQMDQEVQALEIQTRETGQDMTPKKKEESQKGSPKKGISPMVKIGVTAVVAIAVVALVINSMVKAKIKTYDNAGTR